MGEPVFATKTFTDMENSTQSGSSPSPQKSPTCCICTEDITCSTIVNTECNHSFCKDCFWKWTKQNNKCPNCREELIERDRSEELSMMRLLDRRREIVAENEILREEKKILTRRLRDQRKNIRRNINKVIRSLSIE